MFFGDGYEWCGGIPESLGHDCLVLVKVVCAACQGKDDGDEARSERLQVEREKRGEGERYV